MLGIHIAVGICLVLLNLAAGLLGGIAWFRKRPSIPFWYLLRAAQASVFLQVTLGQSAFRAGMFVLPLTVNCGAVSNTACTPKRKTFASSGRSSLSGWKTCRKPRVGPMP